MIEIEISSAGARLLRTEVLTTGRIGLSCKLHFDASWDGLQKTAVFIGGKSADVLIQSEIISVPVECLEAGKSLRVGFYGVNGEGSIVIPTIWVNCGEVRRGAELSGEYANEPTPDLLAQVMSIASEALEIAAQLRNDAENGRFNGERGEQGPQGEPGEAGAKGDPGQPGPAGENGVSPTVQIVSEPPSGNDPGGVSITISDAQGEHSFTLTNGVKGDAGAPGTDGACFTPQVSAAGVLSWTNDGNKTNPQAVDLVNAVIGALPSAVGVSF